MMRDAKLYGVVVASDEDAVVAGAHHFQSAEMPEEAVELNPSVARIERLSREIQDRPLASEREDALGLAGGSVVAACDGHRGREIICSAAHLDGLSSRHASDGRGQCRR